MGNREIKFRAWSRESEKMRDWEFIKNYSNVSKLLSLKHMEVMQFTGLTDKNGVEIYEGDIVNSGYFKNAVVVFWEFGWTFERNECYHNSFNTARHTFEIIGNIHQNPELL